LAESRFPCHPLATLESRFRTTFLVMTRTKFLWTVQSIALLVVAFAFPSKSSAERKEKVLYSFQGNADGATPVGAVVFDKQGNLYGATQDGGAATCPSIYQCGTVYQLAPPAQKGGSWTETVLHVFQGNTNNDGASPFGGLVIDSAGNLYGTTAYGGAGNCVVLGVFTGCGTVFELSPPQQKGGVWTETILYSFQSGGDGYVPSGDLVVDKSGNLYGAMLVGGGLGESNNCDNAFYAYCGTVFELSPPKKKGQQWTEKILHSFAGIIPLATVGDGATPVGGLVLDAKGAIYGATELGGYNCPHASGWGCGTVFKLTQPVKKNGSWTENVLYRFRTLPDGAWPFAGVILDKQSHLYGTTPQGGEGNGSGTIFRLDVGSHGEWAEKILYSFEGGNDGAEPHASLAMDSLGNLMGTTLGAGGANRHGVVFRFSTALGVPVGGALTPLYAFLGSPDGARPSAKLVFNKNGSSFSTTADGGSGTGCGLGGCGTVFEVSP
jgi:uncharacterized repeat protein (TIGR03803 family)